MSEIKGNSRLSKEALEKYLANIIEKDDTFRFDCKMCGSCCRRRSEPIVVTGTDIFYIAKALGITPLEVTKDYVNWNVGPDSRLPIATLRERMDGSCVLMRKSKCMVQSMKPVVCAIFPLGRMLQQGYNAYSYFLQPSVCPGSDSTVEHTLGEWLSGFNVEERDRLSIAWTKLFQSASIAMRKNKHLSANDNDLIKGTLLFTLYVNYPLDQPFEVSVWCNAQILKRILPKFKMPDMEVAQDDTDQ